MKRILTPGLALLVALAPISLQAQASEDGDAGVPALIQAAKDAGMRNVTIERMYSSPITNNVGSELRMYHLTAVDDSGPGQFLVSISMFQGEVVGAHTCTTLRDREQEIIK